MKTLEPVGEGNFIRQGDVNLLDAKALGIDIDLTRCKRVSHKQGERVVLALGEVTGHSHSLNPAVVDEYDAGELWPGYRVIVVQEATPLVHGINGVELPIPDHNTLTIPPGVYVLSPQVMADPFEGVVRNVD